MGDLAVSHSFVFVFVYTDIKQLKTNNDDAKFELFLNYHSTWFCMMNFSILFYLNNSISITSGFIIWKILSYYEINMDFATFCKTIIR